MQKMLKLAIVATMLMLPVSASQAGGVAVNTSTVVEYTTGVNPDDYPCAKAAITNLYHKRGKIADLSKFHPKRIFAWVVDTSVYYTHRFVDFLKGLMNPDAVANGIRKVHSMATNGGNPLAGADATVQGWVRDLSPSSQYVLQKKVHGIIENTTNSDGSCK